LSCILVCVHVYILQWFFFTIKVAVLGCEKNEEVNMFQVFWQIIDPSNIENMFL
jgi:cytochrome b subunit of formate dehydrogenase